MLLIDTAMPEIPFCDIHSKICRTWKLVKALP